MTCLFVKETHVNRTEGYRLGDSGVYETFTDNTGRLFRSLQKEFGRCTGKCYIDMPDGSAKQIGWVFQKRQKYTDCNETYLAETWVTLHSAPPTRTVEYHYVEFGS